MKRAFSLLLAILQLVLGCCAAYCLLVGRTAGVYSHPSLFVFIALTALSLLSGAWGLTGALKRR